MRFNEIVDAEIVQGTLPKGKKLDKGEGKFSRVYKDPQDPHFVIKSETNYSDPESNAYYQYVTAIKDSIDSNPYLPRIYVVNYNRKGNLYKFQYKIERLRSVLDTDITNRLDKDVIVSIGENLFHKFEFHPKYDNSVDMIWYKLISQLHDAIASNDYNNIKDTELVQALKITRKVATRYSLDLGRTNILLRLYPLQIVIADPVA